VNKKGQFFLVATIIIVGLVITLAVTFNYSTKTDSYQAEEIAKELQIESAKVIDYDTMHGTSNLDQFAQEYSKYIGQNKEIYFIIVEGSNKEAYRYVEGIKTDLTNSLEVTSDKIIFTEEDGIYNFNLEDGKNFYFLVIQEIGGERYVFSG
jgi:hypothetical protein